MPCAEWYASVDSQRRSTVELKSEAFLAVSTPGLDAELTGTYLNGNGAKPSEALAVVGAAPAQNEGGEAGEGGGVPQPSWIERQFEWNRKKMAMR
eukprot:846705-Prorocentrum_minimum.AAC.2